MIDQQLGDENCDNGTVTYEPDPHHHKEAFPVLVLGALGVVYGDIGTSPIYAFREALHAASLDGNLSRTDVLGVVSMIFWALTVIVTIKYVLFVLRADNDGEGGILSLMALARASFKTSPTTHFGPRDYRCFAILRRCRDHTGDFSAFCR